MDEFVGDRTIIDPAGRTFGIPPIGFELSGPQTATPENAARIQNREDTYQLLDTMRRVIELEMNLF